MYCIKCGTKLPDDAWFCYKCGYQLNNVTEDREKRSDTNELNDFSMICNLGNTSVAEPIDRKALLVYLERIRDLLVAKDYIEEKYRKERQSVIDEINRLSKPYPRHLHVNQRIDYPVKPKLKISSAIFMGVIFVIIPIPFLGALDRINIPIEWYYFILDHILQSVACWFLLGCILGVPIAFWGLSRRKKAYELEMEKINQYIEEIEQQNKNIDQKNADLFELEKKQIAQVATIKAEWKEWENEIQMQQEKIDQLLEDMYSLDLIPSRFRHEKYYASYIYNMMSSASTLTLNEVIFSTQIDDAVNQIIDTLNRQFERVIDSIHEEGEMIRRQQERYNQKALSQNTKILEQAKKNTESIEEQTRYQRMLVNEQQYTNWLYETELLGIWD